MVQKVTHYDQLELKKTIQLFLNQADVSFDSKMTIPSKMDQIELF